LVSRDFKGLFIPRDIWLHPDLTVLDKCLWAEIDSQFCNKMGGSLFGHSVLAKFLNVTEKQIKDSCQKLSKLNLMIIVSFRENIAVLKAILPR
jgi:hypothetical protein